MAQNPRKPGSASERSRVAPVRVQSLSRLRRHEYRPMAARGPAMRPGCEQPQSDTTTESTLTGWARTTSMTGSEPRAVADGSIWEISADTWVPGRGACNELAIWQWAGKSSGGSGRPLIRPNDACDCAACLSRPSVSGRGAADARGHVVGGASHAARDAGQPGGADSQLDRERRRLLRRLR